MITLLKLVMKKKKIALSSIIWWVFILLWLFFARLYISDGYGFNYGFLTGVTTGLFWIPGEYIMKEKSSSNKTFFIGIIIFGLIWGITIMLLLYYEFINPIFFNESFIPGVLSIIPLIWIKRLYHDRANMFDGGLFEIYRPHE